MLPLLPDTELPDQRFGFGGGANGLERKFEFRFDGTQGKFDGGEAMPFTFPEGFDFNCEFQGRFSAPEMAPFFRNLPFGHNGIDGFGRAPEGLPSPCGQSDDVPAIPADPGASTDGGSRSAAIGA